MEKQDIASLSIEELKLQIKELGLPQFRATQIYDWIHKKGAVSFYEMTNIGKQLQDKLNAALSKITTEQRVQLMTEAVERSAE